MNATKATGAGSAAPQAGGTAGSRAASTKAPVADRVLSTLNRDGSRRWLRPRPMPGRFVSARRIVAFALIAIFAAIPYITLHGKPLVLLDIPARRFIIFGATFLPTDTLLLALLLIGVFVSIFLVTALLGRVWCGWACPQTVYLEFVFRPIERFFDGTPGRRSRRILGVGQGTPATTVLKYATYVVIAAAVAHVFLAYFVGVERLAQWVRQSPLEHPAPFLVMLSTTALMLFDFAFFREQTCIVACPYGRFQSVMLDRNSLIVSYDAKRGEPRGRRHAEAAPDISLRVLGGAARVSAPPRDLHDHDDLDDHDDEDECVGCGNCRGDCASGEAPRPRSADCVDCGMCTVCCPTGIDIRDGLQMECVGCAQCIDACDAVMDKLSRPRGLIRYSSQAAMAGTPSRLLRPRVIVYPALLAVIIAAFTIVLSRSGAFDVTVLRGLGRTFTELSDGAIGNPVRVKIVNRTDAPATFAIAATGQPGLRVESEGATATLAAAEARTVPIIVTAPRDAFRNGRCSVSIEVSDATDRRVARHFELMGPAAGTSHGPRDDRREHEHHDKD